MGTLSGKIVALDLNELQTLCNECMRAIDDQQDEIPHSLTRKVCDCRTEVRGYLPRLKGRHQAVSTGAELPEECCA